MWLGVGLLASGVGASQANVDALGNGKVMMFDQAEWTVSPAGTLPAANADWQTVRLPDSTAHARHDGAHSDVRPPLGEAPLHWYRFEIEIESVPQQGLAVYLPCVADRKRVWVNGEKIMRSFVNVDRIEHAWNRPLLVNIPALALQPGRNQILFGLDAPWTQVINMSRLRVGPLHMLQPAYDRQHRLRVSAPAASTWMLAGLCVFSIGIWWVRKDEPLHLLLGLGAGMFSLRMLHYHVDGPLYSPALFWWVAIASLTWAMVFLFFFAFRYYKLRHAVVERLLLLAAIAVTLLLLPGIGFDAYEHASLAYWVMAPVSVASAGLLFQRAWRTRGLPELLLASGYGVTVVISVYDLAIITRVLSIERAYLMPVGASILFLCFSLALAARYVESLGVIKQMNRILEMRVQERQATLEASFEWLRQLSQESVLADERQRLMREIHDGIGANLVTTLAAVERRGEPDDTAAVALRHAIADLKLTVDSLEPVDGDLLSLLGNLRYRLTPQLKQAGITVAWDVTALPALTWLRAPQALHVLRIAQEAFSNVIQHSGASRVSVSTDTGTSPEGLAGVCVRIADDGRGLPPLDTLAPDGGRGLSNMKWRAKALGGQLRIEPNTPHGTTVALWLPLGATEAVPESG
ncbi:sensor histidine kinase [Polycyclovorans algicola]|uniref:sensor histidine kinase n=1 Tax=Polycyclovorans algicola TaxID=616992 RepID=UPI0004A72662|nr:sensor histidine kinase [Polycyclovorans algicola]